MCETRKSKKKINKVVHIINTVCLNKVPKTDSHFSVFEHQCVISCPLSSLQEYYKLVFLHNHTEKSQFL